MQKLPQTIATWNVNGIRSVSQKGFLDWISQSKLDLVCVQETKAHPDQLDPTLLSPFGYQSYWHSAQKPGYSGVAVYSRTEPDAVRYGWRNSEFDAEGRVIEVDFQKITVINAYFPNSQRDHARLGYKLKFCEAMLSRLLTLEKEKRNVVLCGDFNIAHKPIDLRNPKTNENNAGFLPEEREWMEKLLSSGYLDTFRMFEPGGGHYTWWSYRPGVREKNIGWRLDYHVVNDGFKSSVERCDIYPHVKGSDHCPVVLKLDVS